MKLSISPPAEVETVQPFENLQNAILMYGVEESIVPNWLPDDYGEDIVQVTESPNGYYIVSRCQSKSGEISMEVKTYIDFSDEYRTYEKIVEDAEVFTSNGIEHYITRNSNLSRISWANGKSECSITCELKTEDIYRLIDSIYER